MLKGNYLFPDVGHCETQFVNWIMCYVSFFPYPSTCPFSANSPLWYRASWALLNVLLITLCMIRANMVIIMTCYTHPLTILCCSIVNHLYVCDFWTGCEITVFPVRHAHCQLRNFLPLNGKCLFLWKNFGLKFELFYPRTSFLCWISIFLFLLFILSTVRVGWWCH